MRLEKELDKYLISIHYLNGLLSLEKNTDSKTTLWFDPLCEIVSNLRYDHVGMAHFINQEKDSVDLLYYKVNIVISKINEMSAKCL